MPTQQELDYLQSQLGNSVPANANADWFANNQYNPETGQFEGLGNLPNWTIAPNVQSMANLGAYRAQQRYANQAINAFRGGVGYMQGAQGLLQSYRPGGGAALEAGIYGQTAGLMQNLGGAYFQRAALAQPLDYMFEYRREQQSQARMRANRQIERQNYLTAFAPLGGQVGAATVAGGFGGEGSPGDGSGATTNASGASASSSGGTATGTGNASISSTGGGATASSGALGTVTGAATSILGAGAETDGQTANSTIGQPSGQGQPTKSVQPGGVGAGQGGQGGLNQQQPQQGAQQGAQQPMSGAQGGGGTGAGGGGGGNIYAMQGDFTSRAHAANAAAQIPPQLQAASGMALQDYVSNLYETDPFYQTFNKALDSRWQERMAVRA